MRRTDGPRFALDTSFTRFLEFADWSAPRHDQKPYQADNRIGAPLEGDASNWENLWIDLGGEG
jgi:hypothetical protein